MSVVRLVEKLFPDFPEDRNVVATHDWAKFFKIDYSSSTLYVPTEQAIRANLTLLDKFMDAVGAFTVCDLKSPADWSHTKYYVAQDEKTALQYIEYIDNNYSLIAVDIETRRVELKDNKLLAIGFCGEDNVAYIISCFSLQVLGKLQQLFSRPREKHAFIWHNGKFDTTRLQWLNGVVARVDEDTMYMHYVGINERRGTHSLKDLGTLYLQAPKWDDELDKIKKQYCQQNRIKLKDFTYDMIPADVLWKYLHFDSIATYRLYHTLKSLMRPSSSFIYGKLIEAANVYGQVELNGVLIDLDYLEATELQLETEIKKATLEVSKAIQDIWNPVEYVRDTGARSVPKTFNQSSPKQLQWLLSKITGKNITSTNKEVLDTLYEEVGEQYPAINALRQLRKLNKYMDTYIMGFRDLMNVDGRVHGTYNLHGTETGRLSSSDPNMQNIPRDKVIKNLIVAEEGYKLVQLDYSQAELRVLAYLSKDKFLTGVYQRGEDLHDAVARQMFGPNFTKEQRVQAKTINFGIAYGRGPASLQRVFKITMDEARSLINNWFSQMPDVDKWIKNQRNLATKNIVPETPLGRQRHFVITYDTLNHVQNEYVNFPIQSIASDMTVFSLIEIHNWIAEEGIDARIILNVHDSIVLEVFDEDELIDKVVRKATEIMSTVPHRYLKDNEVPFRADAEVGYSWGNLKGWTPCK